jgi:Zn-dependent protease with chaperone function
MRQAIQSSAVGLMIATLTGDLFSAASMAAALPTMLVDADFSRDMERQADDVAVEYLSRKGETPDHFASILTRIEAAHAGKKGQVDSGGSGITDYFSSHPPTEERIARLKGE